MKRLAKIPEPRQIVIQCAEKLAPILTTPKRIKIMVGGRGASKTMFCGDCCAKFCDDGEQLLLAREYQNSIDQSVHNLMKARIQALEVPGFVVKRNKIFSRRGGSISYTGFNRNISSVKSAHGYNRVWIEEGNDLSEFTLNTIFPTIREEGSEIWITLNRGSSADPIAQRYLLPHDDILKSTGFYEDDDLMIVDINYYDNPWFPEVLERQRQMDYRTLPRADYNHIWLGEFSDQVSGAIIQPEWFDACVDAHVRLNWEVSGIHTVAHDPADTSDPKAAAYMYGNVVYYCDERDDGNVNSMCDWSLQIANNVKADLYTWDGDGMGSSLRAQVAKGLENKKTDIHMFKGSNSVYFPNAVHRPIHGEIGAPKINKDSWYNARSQGYGELRDAVYRTYQAVVQGIYHDPDTLISFSFDGIEKLRLLRSQMCRLPEKHNPTGKFQLWTKPEMAKEGIPSPGMSDAIMMARMATQVYQSLQSKKMDSDDTNHPPAFNAFR